MRKIALFVCLGILVPSLLFLLYEVGRAGNSPQTPEPASSDETVAPSTQTPLPETPVATPSQLLKGSGKFLSIELKETGESVLLVQDELEEAKTYWIPTGLIIRKEEAEIRPSELQKGDILDIDYSLSEKGQRRVTHVDVVISVTEKEMHVEAPAP